MDRDLTIIIKIKEVVAISKEIKAIWNIKEDLIEVARDIIPTLGHRDRTTTKETTTTTCITTIIFLMAIEILLPSKLTVGRNHLRS